MQRCLLLKDSAWKSIEQRPVMGFRKAGILNAISSIRDDPVVENSISCSDAASQSVEKNEAQISLDG